MFSLQFKENMEGNFPGGPAVRTSPSNAGCSGLIPGQGAEIPYASHLKNQSIKQEQNCNKFNKDLKKEKNDPCSSVFKHKKRTRATLKAGKPGIGGRGISLANSKHSSPW